MVLRPFCQLLVLMPAARLLLVLAVAASTAAACGSPSGDAQADALTSAVLQRYGLPDATIILRSREGAELRILAQGTVGVSERVVLIVFDPADPPRVRLTAETWPSREPATLAYAGDQRGSFLFGRLNDPKIVALEVKLPDGGWRRSGVAGPAYVVEVPEADAIPQAWRFIDSSGGVVYAPSGQ